MRRIIRSISTFPPCGRGLLAALAFGIFSILVVQPGPRPAAAQSAGKIAPQSITVGPRVRIGDFMQQSVHQANECINTNSCEWRFSRPPAGKQLIVTRVSCSVVVFNGGLKHVTIFPKEPGEFVFVEHSLEFNQTLNTPPTYVVSDATLALIKSSWNPIVRLESNDSTNGYNGTCGISGQLIDAP
jgi:hypothetical protein